MHIACSANNKLEQCFSDEWTQNRILLVAHHKGSPFISTQIQRIPYRSINCMLRGTVSTNVALDTFMANAAPYFTNRLKLILIQADITSNIQ